MRDATFTVTYQRLVHRNHWWLSNASPDEGTGEKTENSIKILVQISGSRVLSLSLVPKSQGNELNMNHMLRKT